MIALESIRTSNETRGKEKDMLVDDTDSLIYMLSNKVAKIMINGKEYHISDKTIKDLKGGLAYHRT